MARSDRRRLERFFLRAWPAREEVWHGEWVLRANDGYTGRANSATVLTLSPSGSVTIDDVEGFYRARRLPPRFRLLSFAAAGPLDDELARRGFRRHSPTLVMVRSLQALTAEPVAVGHGIEMMELERGRWLDAYAQCRGKPVSADTRQAHGDILRRVAAPLLLAVLMQGNKPVACGAAVADSRRCALFDIAVRPGRRRDGLGRVLVGNLLAWGAARESRVACLQVEMTNRPARHLYARLRFHASHYYWYRTAAVDPV